MTDSPVVPAPLFTLEPTDDSLSIWSRPPESVWVRYSRWTDDSDLINNLAKMLASWHPDIDWSVRKFNGTSVLDLLANDGSV